MDGGSEAITSVAVAQSESDSGRDRVDRRRMRALSPNV